MTEPLPVKKTGWTAWMLFPRKHTHICCDCSLTHQIERRINLSGDVEERWKRDNRATAAERRGWQQKKKDAWQKYFT
jgi:hypothetical protein